MHAACFDIFDRLHAARSTGDMLILSHLAALFAEQALDSSNRGLRPHWSLEPYGGAEKLWQDDWRWLEDQDLEEEIGDIGEWIYLVTVSRQSWHLIPRRSRPLRETGVSIAHTV